MRKGKAAKKPTREELMARLPIPGPGRKPYFETPEQMQVLVDRYFEGLQKDKRPPTLPGLARALGFISRQSLYDYEAKDNAFAYVIKDARFRIEEALTNNLQCGFGSAAGHIFLLKNWSGYMDEQKITHSGNIGSDDLSGYTDDELKQLKAIHETARARRDKRGAVPPKAR